jgi:hypothetical protein
MAKLMRSTEPFWAGNKFVAAGTVLPEDHPDVVPEYFTELVIEEPATGKNLGKAQVTKAKKADEDK